MIRPGNMQCCWLVTVALHLAVALTVVASGTAAAEDSQLAVGPAAVQPVPVSPAANNSLPAQPPPAFKSGFLHELGLWWNQGFGDFNTKMKNAKDRLDDLKQDQTTKDATAATQEALKNAAQVVVHLPSTRVFELHELCHTAANGAPNCPAAADSACRGRGFNAGQPMGISTSQVCPAAVLMSGQTPAAGECRDETYILGVVCQ